jgi:hypothetical protein
MKHSLRWLRRAQQTKAASGSRPRPYRPQLEQLDERLVPSTLSSAISIQHSGWTERDWYTIDQSTSQVVEFQGTIRHNLSVPGNLTPFAVSASVDPNSGSGEVFVLAANGGSTYGSLLLCDSYGNWYNFGGVYTDISATRDGHVYALTLPAQIFGAADVCYVDSSGNSANLGAPSSGVAETNWGWLGYSSWNSIAASVGWFGGNAVFAIGNDGAIYVNNSNTTGAWGLVDNHQYFVSLSANANGTLFALSTGGTVFQETEHIGFASWFIYFYWTEQNITPNNTYYVQISADTDALGQDEVYAIRGDGNLYVHDGGSWTQKDSSVYDIAAADGGYFYDVNYYGGYTTYAYQWNPYVGWTYLGPDFA